jgi:hypothetical protein
MPLVVEVKDLRVEYFAGLRQAHIAMELGDFARADAGVARVQAIAEQTRQPTQRWNAGFTAAAVRCAREQMVANFPGVPAWEGALALACCWIDRRADAAEVLARAAGQHFEHLRFDQTQTLALAMYADTAAQTGSVDAAAILYELLAPYADQFVWNGVASLGHARVSLALLAATLGRPEQADAHGSMPRERSSWPASTATARSSHAQRRSSPHTQPSKLDPAISARG